jgi:hypothetical protein
MRTAGRPEGLSSSLLGPHHEEDDGENPRQDWNWSGRRESNPHRQLGRLELYH